MTHTLLPCPLCGSSATLEDNRLIWCVRCSKCSACVLGERAPEPHGDGESSDEVQDAQAQKMSAETDWAYYENTAIGAWNKRAPLSPDHSGGGAGMVLPERETVPELEDYNTNIDDVAYAEGWNACLDKVKELNQ